jgi:glyoxylase-like metal-dependent hydrolase (beta-lactamase superfamily II)
MSHHSQHHHAHCHTHTHSVPSRRDFLRTLMGTTLSGASMLELAWHRAAWARTDAVQPAADLFDLHKAGDGVFFAHAQPQTVINCNAAVFVRSKDVVVVDAHSKPSAAAALIAQIRREVTEKPVRYVINTHFHWDHTQGNQAYAHTGSKVEFIATEATKQLMSQFSVERMKASRDAVPQQVEELKKRSEKSSSAAAKAFCASEIRHLQAYQAEMQSYELELPTITFGKSYALADPAFDLHLDFHGRSHTAGDVFVFCPQRRAIATGDASHCWVPNIGDGYPRQWPGTIDDVTKLDFQYVLGGHGPMQPDRRIMTCQRNYIEELTQKVADGKAAGLTVEEMEARFTVASLKSLQSNGYGEFLARTQADEQTHFGAPPPLQNDVNGNIRDTYANLDRA